MDFSKDYNSVVKLEMEELIIKEENHNFLEELLTIRRNNELHNNLHNNSDLPNFDVPDSIENIVAKVNSSLLEIKTEKTDEFEDHLSQPPATSSFNTENNKCDQKLCKCSNYQNSCDRKDINNLNHLNSVEMKLKMEELIIKDENNDQTEDFETTEGNLNKYIIIQSDSDPPRIYIRDQIVNIAMKVSPSITDIDCVHLSTQTTQEIGDITETHNDQNTSNLRHIVPVRVESKAAERSRLYRERRREEINQRRRDIRQRQQNLHQTVSNVQNTDEIEQITQVTLNNQLSSISHKQRQQRYYERHKEEINKRKRDSRLKENISKSIPATAAERNRNYRERNRQQINERRRDNRLRQQSLHQIHTASNVQNTDEIDQITPATSNNQLRSHSHAQRQQRYYERHKEEINKRKRDRRLNQNISVDSC